MTTKFKSLVKEPRSMPSISGEHSEAEKAQAESETALIISKSTVLSLTTLDEAFVDFWHYTLLNPIMFSFFLFMICKLKSMQEGDEVDEKKVEWLVIERACKHMRVPSPVMTPLALSPVGTDESAERRTGARQKQSASPMLLILLKKWILPDD